jgi:hypothetical protein
VVLCEDDAHEAFLRAYLDSRGHNRRRLRVVKAAKGRGSAEQFVRERYLDEVIEFRRRAARVSEALFVMTDADALTSNQRRQTLHDTLGVASQAPRGPEERIVLLVPKRSVETWVMRLGGHRVNEDTDYASRVAQADQASNQRKAAARKLHDHCGRTGGLKEADELPSLVEGCGELKRLD